MAIIYTEGFEGGNPGHLQKMAPFEYSGSYVEVYYPDIIMADQIVEGCDPPIKGQYVASFPTYTEAYGGIWPISEYAQTTSLYLRMKIQSTSEGGAYDGIHLAFFTDFYQQAVAQLYSIWGVFAGLDEDGHQTEETEFLFPNLEAGRWHIVELYLDLDPGGEPGTAYLEVRQDGLVAYTGYFNLSFYHGGYFSSVFMYGAGYYGLYLDDFAVGTEYTDFINGDGSVVGFSPCADYTHTWTSSVGTTGYQVVGTLGDYDTVDAAYITADTVNLEDSYYVSKDGASEFDAIHSISGVYRGIRGGQPLTKARRMIFYEANHYPTLTTIPSVVTNYPYVLETNPATSERWTEEEILSTNFRLGIRSITS